MQSDVLLGNDAIFMNTMTIMEVSVQDGRVVYVQWHKWFERCLKVNQSGA